ncbi:ImmA/IrrE family metallo-endopeptidase [Pimelobacter simplex]|uniref:ImmA/IrrE family metallo-endopeptidase n=1 Tax=Nocardioides simplex TaxID=2045 RepID=UPI003AAD2D42
MSDLVTEPSKLSYDAIRDYAERVGKHYSIYGRSGAGDVRDLVRQLGGRVAVGDSRESLHVNEVGNFTIYLPHMTSSRRDRFTIAHELGHYFLHYLHPRRETAASFGRGERNTVETQANVFASSLLMPAEQFVREWTRHGGNARALATVFDVSPNAVEVRAEVLGLRGPSSSTEPM